MYAVFKVQLMCERQMEDMRWKFTFISMYYVCYARHVSVVTEQALLVRFAHICGCLIQHPSGDEEIRTLDPLLARQVLSQLSYIPIGYFPYLFFNSAMPEPVGLSGLEPPTSRLSGVRSNQLSYKPFLIWRPPALPHRLQCSTIGRLGLNRRVRDGYGCFPQTHRHQKFFSYSVTS